MCSATDPDRRDIIIIIIIIIIIKPWHRAQSVFICFPLAMHTCPEGRVNYKLCTYIREIVALSKYRTVPPYFPPPVRRV
jgi:hypothetical protein